MTEAFVDRERELAALRQRLGRPSSLSLVYGQRRAGKTWLLQHLAADEPGLIYSPWARCSRTSFARPSSGARWAR